MSENSLLLQQSRRSELLARALPELVNDIAERALDLGHLRQQLIVTHPSQIGLVMMQVREPVCRERFYLGEVVATRAEVMICGQRGWSMRLGSDREAALGAAICDALAELGDDVTQGLATEVHSLCERTDLRLDGDSAQEWNELAQTIVDFEELD